MTARHKQRGVSLLEALIAVALLAGLATLLEPPLFSSMRLSNTVLANAVIREDMRVAEEALNQILTNMFVIDQTDEALRFRGDEKGFEAVSLAGTNTARRFSLKIENGALIGQIEPLINADTTAAETLILTEGALQFSYFGRPAQDAPLIWSGDWRGSLPPLIVRLEIARGDHESETAALEVPVAARGPLHCAFDTVSRRCRN